MSIKAHYVNNAEREAVADALYHEGLGYLNKPEFVSNIPNVIGSPGEAARVEQVVADVLAGTYRGDLVECDKPDCYCH